MAQVNLSSIFSQGLHLELKDHGVHVQAVLPSATKTEIWERSGIDLSQVPPLMDVNDLVDAALIGFDRKETITIPVLKDENQWNNFEKSRMTLLPNFSSAEVAQRYKNNDYGCNSQVGKSYECY